MPGYRAHLASAVPLFVLAWWLYGQYACDTIVLAMGCLSMLGGAIFPDCDTRSKARQILHVMFLPLCILLLHKRLYFLVLYACAVMGCGYISSHRGVTHTLWLPAFGVFTLCLYAMHHNVDTNTVHWVAACFMIGHVSHIVLDRWITR